MLRIFLTCVALHLLCISPAYAQDWQCLQPGVIRYFTGGGPHFLRGIRIDSTRTVNNTTVLYPFHSPRGAYQTPAPNPFSLLDTNGGSWLGKAVTIQQDGIMRFDNLWGDTVFIRTTAHTGDSWTMYDDTSSRYYIATVTGQDTMTVLNILDSVKTITIAAYAGGNINTADPCNNQAILLSKDHGFVRVLPLYSFPFHPPQLAGYTSGNDFLTDKRDMVNGSLISYELTDFLPPDLLELYSFDVGDVFEYHRYEGYHQYWQIDTIVSKTLNGPSIVYGIARGLLHWNPPVMPAPAYYTYTHLITSANISSALLFPGMPEEKTNGVSTYYTVNNAPGCFPGNQYGYDDGLYDAFAPEPCYITGVYHTGLGRTGYSYCDDPGNPASVSNVSEELIYYKKGGQSCGNFVPVTLGIQNLAKPKISIYPNPVTGSELNIAWSAAPGTGMQR